MGLLKVLDHVAHCYTNADGDAIRQLVIREIQEGNKVVLSFKGVDSVSSSFLNSALIDLLDRYTFEQVKSMVAFSDTSKAINDAIKRRFSFEVNERKKLIGV
jgi:hypothetical protein